ncbi:hypothetical protein H0H87_012561, partial [Tephrocybe sp. NHM501043]
KSKDKNILKNLIENILSSSQPPHLPSSIPVNQPTSEPTQASVSAGQQPVQRVPGAGLGLTSISPTSTAANKPGNATLPQALGSVSAVALASGGLMLPVSASLAGQSHAQLAPGLTDRPASAPPALNIVNAFGNTVMPQAPSGNLNAMASIISAPSHSQPALAPVPYVLSESVPPISSLPSSTPASVYSAAAVPRLPVVADDVTPSAAVTHIDDWAAAKSGLEATLCLLSNSADVFPPLKSAVGGILGLIDLFKVTDLSPLMLTKSYTLQNAAVNHKDYAQLKSELGLMVETLKQYGELKPKDPSDSAARIFLCVNDEVEKIEKVQLHAKSRQPIEANKDSNDIIKQYCTIQSLIQQLQVGYNTIKISQSILTIWVD